MDRKNMRVISHRGASGYAPENTISAFNKALEMKATNFEFDVHRTKDGILVVHHDYHFKRTAGIELEIKDLTYEEIKKINVAKHFDSSITERVPTLDEVIEIIGEKADFINIEVKNDNNVYSNIERDLIDFLNKRKNIFPKIMVSSFDFDTLKRIRGISPEIRIGYLGRKLKTIALLPSINEARSINCENFHLSRKIAFKFNLKILMAMDFNIGIFTVNEKAEALKFQNMGVWGIFSNYPDILK